MRTSTTIKPGWLMNNEPGSFAESTIIERKPQILNRLLKENGYPDRIQKKIYQFRDEISYGAISYLSDNELDAKIWNEQLTILGVKTWLELPWFFAEAYFYRRLLEITGYYQSGSTYYEQDPFDLQKKAQIEKDIELLQDTNWLFKDRGINERFNGLLHAALWGNRADLSNEHVALSHTRDEYHGAAHLIELLDDSNEVAAYLGNGIMSTAYFLDNVGRELFSDLALIQFLLEMNWVQKITIVTKSAPFFVSDAMIKDVYQGIEYLKQSGIQATEKIALSLGSLLSNGRLEILACKDLSMYYMYSEFPESFFNWIVSYDLLILKGDANYRRVVEDRHWSFSTPTNDITLYFKNNLLLIRTLKSELMTGLEEIGAMTLPVTHPDWLISGNFGLIQFLKKN